jgi:hypothetical protein
MLETGTVRDSNLSLGAVKLTTSLDIPWNNKEQARADHALFALTFDALMATEDSVADQILCSSVVALVHTCVPRCRSGTLDV